MANFKAKAKKYVKKQVKRAGGALKKRYVKRGGNLNVAQIAKDVMTLKKVINSEVKRTGDGVRFHQDFVGQMNGTSSGHHIVDISPSFIAQGNNYNERSGNSIKLKSLMLQGQLVQQSACNQRVRVSIEVWMRKRDTVGIAAAISEIYQPNAFATGGSPLYDYNSQREPDYYADWVCIRKIYRTVASDTVSPQINQVVNWKMPISFGKGVHVRWDSSGTYTEKQILFIVRADCGNRSTSTAGSFGAVATNAINTGLSSNFNYQYFYYDN